MDLRKCFDSADHESVVASADLTGLPAGPTRLSLALYAWPRRLVCNGAVSREIRAKRGLIAGTVPATYEVKATMIQPLDEVVANYPDAMVQAHVAVCHHSAKGTSL